MIIKIIKKYIFYDINQNEKFYINHILLAQTLKQFYMGKDNQLQLQWNKSKAGDILLPHLVKSWNMASNHVTDKKFYLLKIT